MSRKSDAETLEALKARKAELDEKIRQKEAAIKEKIRAEEARKRAAEKRHRDHVKYILGGFFIKYICKEAFRLALLKDKVDITTEDGFIKLGKIYHRIYKSYAFGFSEKDRDSVQDVLVKEIGEELEVYRSSPEAYLASLGEKPAGGESVSSFHGK